MSNTPEERFVSKLTEAQKSNWLKMTAQDKQILIAKAEEDERQSVESIRFLQKNVRLKRSKENASRLAAYVNDHGLPWSMDSLQTAAEAMKHELDYKTDDEVYKPVAPVAQVKDQPFPWPTPLNARVINDMPRADYRKFLRDPRFSEQIAALNFKR